MKYHNLSACDVLRLKQLDGENRKLEQVVTDLRLANQMLHWVQRIEGRGLPRSSC